MDLFVPILAVICAYIVKGMSGFANTLIFSTILSFTRSTVNITPVELILGYPANFYFTWKERKKISFKIVGPLSLLVILGSIPGAFFLKLGDIRLIKVVLGFVVISIAVEMLLHDKKKQAKNSPVVLACIGILSGILSGLFGIGAFLAAYVNRTTDSQSQFRGNLCFVFLVENTFRLLLYSITGLFNWHIIKSAFILLPFMVIGLAIGTSLSLRVNDRMVKKIVSILLILSGISVVLSNLLY